MLKRALVVFVGMALLASCGSSKTLEERTQESCKELQNADNSQIVEHVDQDVHKLSSDTTISHTKGTITVHGDYPDASGEKGRHDAREK